MPDSITLLLNDLFSFAFCTFVAHSPAGGEKCGIEYEITILGCFRSSSDCGFKANAFSVSNAQVIWCEDLQASLCEKQKGAGSVSLWLHPKGSPARSFLKAEVHGLGTCCLQSLPTLAHHAQPCWVASLHPSSWAVQSVVPACSTRRSPEVPSASTLGHALLPSKFKLSL